MPPQEFHIKRSELSSFKASLQPGDSCTVVILDGSACFVEMGDSFFRPKSGILLPVQLDPSSAETAKSGLGLIAGCLSYASKNPDRKLLVIGNTEPSGNDAADVRISQIRAATIHGLLTGDREQFAQSCHGPHLTAEQRYPDGGSGKKRGVLWDDYIDVLNWIALKFGWPCSHPRGNATLWAATVAFQKAYNKSQIRGADKPAVPENGSFDLKSWGAVYDCYENKLLDALGLDPEGLASLRAKLSFLSPATENHLTGCGGNKPVSNESLSLYTSKTNHRVDATFFPPDEDPMLPCMAGACAPGTCHLEAIKRIPIPTPSTDSGVRCTMARLIGAYFDTNKCFLLPNAVPTIKKLVDLYKSAGVGQQQTGLSQSTAAAGEANEILIVGHTDTSGTSDYNQTLSEERAASMASYLKNDVDAWLKWFESGISDSKRWGAREEQLMMLSLVPPADWEDQDLIATYQKWHNARDTRTSLMTKPLPPGWQPVTANGTFDSATRRQLIIDYMDIDGTTLSPDVPICTVGCGERYPLTEADGELATQAANGQHQQFNRRVEVFFFDRSHGIDPPATGSKESGQYPTWRSQSAKDQTLDPLRKDRVELRVHNRQLQPLDAEIVVFKFPGDWAVGVTDEAGLLEVPGPDPHVCVETTLYWGSSADHWEPQHSQGVLFGCGEDDGGDRDWSRMHNLGFHLSCPISLRLAKFRSAYGIDYEPPPTDDLPPSSVVEKLGEIWNDRECVATPVKSR